MELNDKEGRTQDSLAQEAKLVLDEARMIVPGIQALFGFQLVGVFSPRFDTALTALEQDVHLAALLLVTLSIALIMAPAAYHRQAGRGEITSYFIELSSRLVTWAMAPLLVAISLDSFLVARIILHSLTVSIIIATVLLGLFIGLWFVFPRWKVRHKL